MQKISFYYQKLENVVSPADDLPALIELHTKSFERHGWEVVHLDESVAQRHPRYAVFDDPTTILNRSMNPWEYTRACYMRWLAYAVAGTPFADFDVINYGFSPDDANEVKGLNKKGDPIFLSGAGAMGLFEGSDYARVIDTYLDFIDSPRIEGPMVEDINDMTIMRHLHPEWYDCIPYTDPRFVKDYSRDGWEVASLVHYAYGLTGSPRAGIINDVRRPEV